MDRKSSEMILLSGNSHPELANQIAKILGIHVGSCSIVSASNSESLVHIGESLRGKDVYIVQTGTKDVNNDVVNLLILAYTCKTSSARMIVGIIPYLPYCKQSKMSKRGCIASKLLARMMEKAGYTQIVTMDLHLKEVQGFFDIPVDNLRAIYFLIKFIKECIPDYQNAVVVAKDPISVPRAIAYARRLVLDIAVVYENDVMERRHAPKNRKGRSINVIGNVNGKDAIIVANIIDDAEPFVTAAEVLKDRGAKKIYIVATHGLFSPNAPALFEHSRVDEIVVTNTIPHDAEKTVCHKIKTVDVSTLLSEAIRRIHNKESNFLFVPQYYFGR